MNYTIEIYLYDNKLIFTGTRDLYFEKYKGNGPGVYSNTVKIRKVRGQNFDFLPLHIYLT